MCLDIFHLNLEYNNFFYSYRLSLNQHMEGKELHKNELRDTIEE